MALATLYSRALSANKTLPRCHGIIIDHKVRPESTEEAEWVAQQLRLNIGISSTVIPLVWPEFSDPNSLQRFESDARRLRYQALGRACKENNITSLMVAHHANDQAETIFMRLIMERWRTGLKGIRGIEGIPECYGMHGIDSSGGLGEADQKRMVDGGIPYPVEKGGMQLLRPLLGIEKKRLIATCEEYGTAWAEDKTNQTPTTTCRNAIRHILKNHKLPAALSEQSLVGLSVQMQERLKVHREHAEYLFNNCLLKLDIQTGSLIVRFPETTALLDQPIVTESDKSHARNTAYLLFERITEIVSPKQNPSIGQLTKAVETVYPALSTEVHAQIASKKAHTASIFCAFGVWFHPWIGKSVFTQDPSLPDGNGPEWLLSRQPLEDGKMREPGTCITFPPSSTAPEIAEQWHLFDGRFWFRINNHTPDHDLILRTLEPEDVRTLDVRTIGKSYAAPSSTIMRIALSLFKPADLRRHIPALFSRPTDSSSAETLIALPTLGASTASPSTCTWQIRYKKVDFGQRSAAALVASGISATRLAAAARSPKAFLSCGDQWLAPRNPAELKRERRRVKDGDGGGYGGNSSNNSGPKATYSVKRVRKRRVVELDGGDVESLERLLKEGSGRPLVEEQGKGLGQQKRREKESGGVSWSSFGDRMS
ncbi:PP-loop family-domain-containing protein [Massariosphaeria phaeospora]|uniref:tRNA(Ile)-lysidine synthetase n=1 Tax=Massariosphaeria phaeospora TaxID=100035 RepID=A0A7C8MI15_9PLEO|nr:PP-loop family-domain-containing protein [Massariosphaeria phaeospora]